MQQVSVLETNIGASTSGNSANTQVIFNDNGVLRGDAGLTYNASTDALTIGGLLSAGSATITGDLTVKTNLFKVDTTNNRVGIGTASPAYALDVVGVMQLGGTTNPVLRLATGTNTGFLDYDNTRLQIHAGSLPIYFVAGNTLKATLDTSGNLGLGVTPSAWGSGTKAFELANGSVISFAGYIGTIGTANSYYNGSNFIYKTTAPAARYDQDNGAHKWYTAASGPAGTAITDFATAVMTLNANAALVLKGGNTSANGVGITFPATQVASSDANTLDDYEEGTFTPTVQGSTTAGVGTYNQQVGYYTKVGRLVTVNVWLQWTNTTGTGNLRFGGLPFTIGNISGNYGGISIGYVSNIALTAGNIMYGLIEFGSTFITATQTPTGGGSNSVVPIDPAGEIAFTATYYV